MKGGLYQMVYHAKVNVFLLAAVYTMIWLIGFVSIVSLIPTFTTVLSMFAILIISAVLMWWYTSSIRYVFYEEYLLVKGGPFKERITYQSIEMAYHTEEKMTGYQISSSNRGLELFLKHRDNIKILPNDLTDFVSELRKRCPGVRIAE
ncbi:PH domain-containing protein [Metabacillus mangrovi]|nr:PH domain-containing protein [Metabacillus mangrovi]